MRDMPEEHPSRVNVRADGHRAVDSMFPLRLVQSSRKQKITNPPMAQYECLEQQPRRFFFFGMTDGCSLLVNECNDVWRAHVPFLFATICDHGTQ